LCSDWVSGLAWDSARKLLFDWGSTERREFWFERALSLVFVCHF